MATGFGVFSAGMAAFSAISGSRAASKARGKQRELDRINQANYLRETKELVRRTERSQRIRSGNIRGQAYASGFAKGSSLDRYVDSVVTEQSATLSFLQTSRSDVSAFQKAEENARFSISKNIADANLVSGLFGAVGSAVSVPETYQKYGWGFTSKS